jgi:hypothetical protein
MAKAKHNWAKLDPHIDNLKAQGWTETQIAKELNIGRQTLVDHLRSRASVHLGIPETTEVIEVSQDIPGHPGTLEGYQEVIEDLQESVPEVAHLVTETNTYVFDMRHVALMDRYAQEHHLDLKEVMFLALEEFFQRRGYLNESDTR